MPESRLASIGAPHILTVHRYSLGHFEADLECPGPSETTLMWEPCDDAECVAERRLAYELAYQGPKHMFFRLDGLADIQRGWVAGESDMLNHGVLHVLLDGEWCVDTGRCICTYDTNDVVQEGAFGLPSGRYEVDITWPDASSFAALTVREDQE